MKGGLGFVSNRTLLVSMLIFLAALVATVILLSENLNSMFQALYRANYYYVPLAVLVYLFGILVWSLRWHTTISSVGSHVSVRSLYAIIFSGIFLDNITPLAYAGGDPLARAFMLKKTQNVPFSKGFATILAEYVVDLPVYISLLILGILISVKQTSIWYGVFMFAIWLLFLIGWGFFFMHLLSRETGARRLSRLASKLAGFLHRRVNAAKLERSIRGFYRSSERIIRNRRVFLYVAIFTVAIWSLAITRLYVIFMALGYPPQVHMLFFAITLPALVGMIIPLLPGGLGTVDAAIVSVFLVSGVPVQIAISAALIERAITLVFGTMVGAGAISYLGLRQGNSKRPGAKKPR